MYAIHFVLFVVTLVVCHIIQSCLKPFARHDNAEPVTEEPTKQEANNEEEDENCLWAPWSAWSECTVTCGDGISVRHRIALILGNCTGDMIQEKICSEQHCPHDKDFIFQRQDDEKDESSEGNWRQPKPDKIQSEDQTTHYEDQGEAKTENVNPDETADAQGGRTAGNGDAQTGSFNSENDFRFDENEERHEDIPRGRARGQSWTSDDGNAWGQQSSFSWSDGEGAGNCFSDCSPTDPPADGFGSAETSGKNAEPEGEKSRQGEDQRTFSEAERSGGEGQEESFAKDSSEGSREKDRSNGDGSREKDRSTNEQNRKADGEKQENDADTDFENDEDDYDDDQDGDFSEGEGDDESGTKKDGSKKRKQEHEEENEEQDDLEQEEGKEERTKRRKRKKKRKRKRKQKACRDKQDTSEVNDSCVVCDPTEICDTFMAAVETCDSASGLTSLSSEIEDCDSVSNLTSRVSENENCRSGVISTSHALGSENCDSTNKEKQ